MKQKILNEAYVEARNKLIPEASQMALKIPPKNGEFYGKHEQGRNFMRCMVILAEREGLTAPGNVALLDAKDLPSRVSSPYLL